MRQKICGVYGEIDTLPGCSQVGVSHSVYCPEALRGKGIASEANKRRTVFMKMDYGYDYALCTVDLANLPQIKIMQVNGWRRLDAFTSSRTGHLVGLFGKGL